MNIAKKDRERERKRERESERERERETEKERERRCQEITNSAVQHQVLHAFLYPSVNMLIMYLIDSS